MLNQETHKLCVGFIRKNFPSAKHVILSGSQAINRQSNKSDYDIIILERSIDKFKSERIIYLSRLFDVMAIPVQKIDDIMVLDHKDGHGIFTGMLSKGVVIIDNDNVAESLISICKQRYEIGLRAKDMDYLHKLKIQVQDYLDDLKGSSKSKEWAYLKVLRLATKYVDFALYYNGLWKGNSQVNYAQLEKIEPNLNNTLQDAISAFFCNGNPEPIVNTIEQQMDKYGVQKTLNISGATGNYIDQDYFVMKVVDQDENIMATMGKFRSRIYEILKLLDNPETFWFFIPNNLIKGESLVNQIYLIAFQNQELINKKIQQISRRLVEISNNSISYYGPLNLDISLVFSPCFSSMTFQNTINMFCKKLLSQNTITKSKAILIALEATHYIASLTKKYKAFNDYLFDCWFPASFDLGTHLNVHAILESKKKKLQEFKKTFYTQREGFSSFLNELKVAKSYFLSEDLKQVIQDFHKEGNEKLILHPFHLTGFDDSISDFEKKEWYKMKTCLDSILGSLLIEEIHRSYFPFALNQLN